MMNKETAVSLFNSIVRCLSGREVTVYFETERTSIKRDDTTSKSTTCYISCNSNVLSIFRTKDTTEPIYNFMIDKLMVAKIYHSEKKKYTFGIAYDNIKYRFKFDQEGPCARIHAALLEAIK